MFKLQYYLLTLTFSQVYENQKSNIKIIGGGMNLGILQGRGGISLLGNKDEPIFRGHVLPDQPELLVIFYKLFQ